MIAAEVAKQSLLILEAEKEAARREKARIELDKLVAERERRPYDFKFESALPVFLT